VADEARNKEWRNKEYREVNNERDDCVATGSAPDLSPKNLTTEYRGVAQLGTFPSAAGGGCSEE